MAGPAWLCVAYRRAEPERGIQMLSEPQIEQFARYGYLALAGFLGAAELGLINEAYGRRRPATEEIAARRLPHSFCPSEPQVVLDDDDLSLRGEMGRYPKIPAPALNRISPPLAGVLNVVSARWGPLVIMALSDGHIRFNDLQRHLEGVSHKVLIETLRMLQREGIVCRVPIAEPVQNMDVAEYRLTDMGRDLFGWIEAIRLWAELRSIGRNQVGRPARSRKGKDENATWDTRPSQRETR